MKAPYILILTHKIEMTCRNCNSINVVDYGYSYTHFEETENMEYDEWKKRHHSIYQCENCKSSYYKSAMTFKKIFRLGCDCWTLDEHYFD